MTLLLVLPVFWLFFLLETQGCLKWNQIVYSLKEAFICICIKTCYSYKNLKMELDELKREIARLEKKVEVK